ncbi:MAG TPA: Asd/ArgC dimerization domain-containing protein, partial [Candidatus Angelobacter sp.]|nr:Asd/ArgC dimerization domain-containing protein [Candidatus Angelobacter sp.]
MKTETQNLFRVAVVGGATLKGKELKDVLEERNFPTAEVKLLDDDESLGQLERVQDEIAVVQPVSRDSLARMDFTFFASDEEFTRKNWKLAREVGSAIIDMSYALENEPNVPVFAPWIERERGQHTQFTLESSSIVTAHPVAVVLALLLLRAGKAGAVRNAMASVFEPVSEQGRGGMDELHEQTVNLLSFQTMPTGVFGTQVAFNMIDRYGRSSLRPLDATERRVTEHLRRLLGNDVQLPALTMLQAPVFHAHTLSIYLEMEKTIAAGDLTRALAGEHVQIARTPEDAPSNVNVAGKDEILVSVRRDSVHENGFWLWAAVDNLRLAALTAADCA